MGETEPNSSFASLATFILTKTLLLYSAWPGTTTPLSEAKDNKRVAVFREANVVTLKC